MLALEWNLDDAKQAWQEESREQGRKEEREAVAVKIIRTGLQFDDIQRATDLPLQRIQELAADKFNN